MLFKLFILLPLAAPLLALNPVYTDCRGGSLLTYCETTLDMGFASTTNDKFHRVTPAHEFFSFGVCKITYWTSAPLLQFSDTLGFKKVLKEIDHTCTQKNLTANPVFTNRTEFSGVFVGFVEPYNESVIAVQVNGFF
ncbi:hypothetical protein CROQUDRAFT_663763 [Cronartium quercuum f. sp. fusiforme G11]|uniref:Uncharacterized protein n=1 Tax=Cronartium quercuum f. sp. fusiforme G11 TaxID=708437 RepID=A0A9P6NC15_9BASI|nr:hypothetical protein CROQUDRAFT_663763 [Cronartium quercuum f. sp. fusiforme G11]